VHFPGIVNTVHVARERSLRAVRWAMAGSKQVLVLSQRDMSQGEPEPEELHETGTLSEILQASPFPDGSLRIIVRGICRSKAEGIIEHDGFYWSLPRTINDQEQDLNEPLVTEAREAFLDLATHSPAIPQEAAESIAHIDSPGELGDTIAHYLALAPPEKQMLLQTDSVKERLEEVYRLVRREAHVRRCQEEIRSQTDARIAESQREYVLREQLKSLQKELLGDSISAGTRLREAALERRLPERVRHYVEDQSRRLDTLPEDSAEAAVSARHLETLLEVPWTTCTAKEPSLQEARAILDEDHRFLGEAKERILEFLAVRKLTGGARSPILCFEGPPGVGKTTLAQAVARALGRSFVCLSLGGLRDEAELRGHRRTYVGAHAGRIVRGLTACGSVDPLFLLDEIDKVSFEGSRSDVAASLLEILDPSLNKAFVDHFLELPVDLSNVVFVATANSVQSLPPALRDRIEVVSFPSYSNRDRAMIAKGHLLPKLLREHGLVEGDLRLDASAIEDLVGTYTCEAGVRDLERAIASLCRKAAKSKAGGAGALGVVSRSDLKVLLGASAVKAERRESMPGTVWGLVVAPYGGDAVQIEAAFFPPNGMKPEICVTGNMGAIMRESAEAAVSFARLWFGENPGFGRDLHIHASSGDRSKEGPSAGLAIAIAVISALHDFVVPSSVAITGEITLRGQVLPVGGVREKLLAAQRLGFRKVILPADNYAEAIQLPEDILSEITILPVSTADDALRELFAKSLRFSTV
jgi:ATP-dependent Lon protease